MSRYISLLRGINVSGQKLIKMDTLKQLYQSLGLHDVVSYVQSGNLIFSSDEKDSAYLSKKLSEKIEEVYGFEVPVIILSVEQLRKIVDDNPFKDNAIDISSVYVTFLSSAPHIDNVADIESRKKVGEEFVFDNNVVYIYCPSGYGTTKLTNKLFESKLKVVATTRNWKTVTALLNIGLQ